MKSLVTILCLALLPAIAYAADPVPAKPNFPPPTDEDLQKIVRMPCRVFPWVANPPPKPPEAAGRLPEPKSEGASIDLSSGDIIVKALGEFAFTDGPQPGKQLLTLNKQVEIEQVATKSVMRAEKFRIIVDQVSGNTDLIEANGDVQFVQPPDQKGRCEMLTRETKFGSHGEPLKDLTTLEGNRTAHTKATVWQGSNAIEAERIINDGRLNTFHAMGSPAAVVTTGDVGADSSGMAPSTGPMAAPKPAGTTSVSMMPGIGLSSGGVVRMQCDGELFYEGASGRVNLARNVLIQQGDPKVLNGPAIISIASDDAHLILDLPPMGQPDSAGKLFSGTPKSLTCIGRVEIKTSTHTILCDRGTFDLIRNSFVLEMKNPKEDVSIYIRESPTSGQLMLSQRSLAGNTASSDFKPATGTAGMRYGAWPAVIPTNRPTQPKTEK